MIGPKYLKKQNNSTIQLVFSLCITLLANFTYAQEVSVTASTQLQSADYAIDGDINTRWESEFGIDPSFITVDLGEEKPVYGITILWEAANASDYLVRGFNGVNWDTLSVQENLPAGERKDVIDFTGTYRYIQIYATARSTDYGYSIWELKVDTNDSRHLSVAQASTQVQDADFAIDGNMNTRWESQWRVSPSFITLDLGEEKELHSMTIHWEAANASDYLVRGYNGVNWDTLSSQEGLPAGDRSDVLDLYGQYRYIQIYSTKRSTEYGYSIWEIEVDASAIEN